MGGWKDRADEQIAKASSGKNFKLAEGDNELRVLPTKKMKGDKDPYVYLVSYVHANVGPDKKFLTCGNDRCYTCNKKIPKLEASDSKAKRKQAEAAKKKGQMIVQVAVKDGKKWRGPHKFTMNEGGKDSLSYRLLKTLRNPKYDCADPVKGRNITIEREGQGLATSYGHPVIGDKEELPSKILKAMKTFDELVPPYDEEKHKAAWEGREADSGKSSASDSDDSDSKGDSDMAGKKKSRKKGKGNKASAADSDEDASSTAASSAADSDKDSSDDDSDKKKKSSDSDDSDDSSSKKSSADDSDADSDAKPKGKKGKKGKKDSDDDSSSKESSDADDDSDKDDSDKSSSADSDAKSKTKKGAKGKKKKGKK